MRKETVNQQKNKKSVFLVGFVFDLYYLCRINYINRMIMEIKNITKEDVLRRYRSTRERKEKRLEEMKEILYKRYVNRTGEEPKYFFTL